jgi:hypothetical protein
VLLNLWRSDSGSDLKLMLIGQQPKSTLVL